MNIFTYAALLLVMFSLQPRHTGIESKHTLDISLEHINTTKPSLD